MEKFLDIVWWYKIPDSKYTGKKPFDVIGVREGKPLAIEFKIQKSLNRWPYSRVIDYQVKSLSDFAKAGGEAKVVLIVKARLTDKQKEAIKAPSKLVSLTKVWTIEEFKLAVSEGTHFDLKKYAQETFNNV